MLYFESLRESYVYLFNYRNMLCHDTVYFICKKKLLLREIKRKGKEKRNEIERKKKKERRRERRKKEKENKESERGRKDSSAHTATCHPCSVEIPAPALKKVPELMKGFRSLSIKTVYNTRRHHVTYK